MGDHRDIAINRCSINYRFKSGDDSLLLGGGGRPPPHLGVGLGEEPFHNGSKLRLSQITGRGAVVFAKIYAFDWN